MTYFAKHISISTCDWVVHFLLVYFHSLLSFSVFFFRMPIWKPLFYIRFTIRFTVQKKRKTNFNNKRTKYDNIKTSIENFQTNENYMNKNKSTMNCSTTTATAMATTMAMATTTPKTTTTIMANTKLGNENNSCKIYVVIFVLWLLLLFLHHLCAPSGYVCLIRRREQCVRRYKGWCIKSKADGEKEKENCKTKELTTAAWNQNAIRFTCSIFQYQNRRVACKIKLSKKKEKCAREQSEYAQENPRVNKHCRKFNKYPPRTSWTRVENKNKTHINHVQIHYGTYEIRGKTNIATNPTNAKIPA